MLAGQRGREEDGAGARAEAVASPVDGEWEPGSSHVFSSQSPGRLLGDGRVLP